MASTYSTNLKIELIGTGEQSGAWGAATNTNLGTALEQAIVGLGSPVFSTDADLTISLSNSSAAQTARAFVLNVTSGVSLTTTRNLIVPTIEKPYVVSNATTGGQSITVKTSAGTGVAVPNGARVFLYADGTNVVQMQTKDSVGLGNVDNTSDANKPVSTATQTALNAKQDTLVSGTNIKTVNSTSLLGSGNVAVGDVVGPASSTDNTLARFDGTTGKLLQGSGVVVDDSGNLTLNAGRISVEGTGYSVLKSTANGQTPSSVGLSVGYNRSGANGETSLVWGAPAGGVDFELCSYNGTTVTPRVKIDTNGNATFVSGTFGYGTGAGGTVTQATSKSTDVTLNKPSGQITMNNAALAAGATVSFLLNNTLLAAADSLCVNVANTGSYRAETIFTSAGAGQIRLTNITGGSLSEAVLISYAIIKGATA